MCPLLCVLEEQWNRRPRILSQIDRVKYKRYTAASYWVPDKTSRQNDSCPPAHARLVVMHALMCGRKKGVLSTYRSHALSVNLLMRNTHFTSSLSSSLEILYKGEFLLARSNVNVIIVFVWSSIDYGRSRKIKSRNHLLLALIRSLDDYNRAVMRREKSNKLSSIWRFPGIRRENIRLQRVI